MIRQTFRKLGLSLTINGSEDNEIRVKDIPSLQVGDWHLDLPAGKQEDVYRALDPNETEAVVDASINATSQPEYILDGEEDAEVSDWDSEQDDDHEVVDKE